MGYTLDLNILRDFEKFYNETMCVVVETNGKEVKIKLDEHFDT